MTASKVMSGSIQTRSSTGKLFCDDLVRRQWYPCLATAPVFSLGIKQWEQLGENLGGVRFPERGASRGSVRTPTAREVVSNRAIKMKMKCKRRLL